MSSTPKSRLPVPLTDDDQRQILYASLLRYAPETVPLRERALERVVLSALIGSSETNPLRIGSIQTNLKFGASAPEIRVESIQAAIEKLVIEGKVARGEVKKRNAYYIVEESNEDLSKAIQSATRMFETVIGRLLKDLEPLIPHEKGTSICRTFIIECFTRFGRQIAKTVTGQLGAEDLARKPDVTEAFKVAIRDSGLEAEAIRSLKTRCVNFLKSSEPDDEKLKFYLTQGYYFAELLGLQNNQFDPLAEQAFANSVFYIDTNVLIVGLVSIDERAALFEELVQIAKRAGIKLRVTRATMNEARRVAADRTNEIARFILDLPEEFTELTNDRFLNAFLEAREMRPSLTPQEFMDPFEQLSETLAKWGIDVDDLTEEEIIGTRDLADVKQIIQEEAVVVRRHPKSANVVKHDLCHFAHVTDQRTQNPKTWFLTDDRSLLRAAARLVSPQMPLPFCFSLAGFLQSISPFLITKNEEQSFTDTFTHLLAENIFPTGTMFEIKELLVINQMHEDVLSSPSDQLVPALDYVKRNVLQGRPYRISDMGNVALALRKFTVSSADERRRMLENEAERFRKDAKTERGLREELQKRTALQRVEDQEKSERDRAEAEEEWNSVLNEKEERITRAEADKASMQEQIEGLRDADTKKGLQISTMAAQFAEAQQRQRRLYVLFGFVIGASLWIFNDTIFQVFTTKWASLAQSAGGVRATIGTLGSLVFTLPVIPFIKYLPWRPEFKVALLTAVVAVSIAFSRLVDPATWSAWSAYVTIGAAISAMLVFGIFRKHPQ
jgi:hypothetical protein